MRPVLTLAIWAVSLGCVAVGGGIAVLFVTMPVSLDIGEMIAAGAGPWRDAALAAAAFAGLVLAASLSLWLWHRRPSRGPATAALAWAIAAAELALVASGVVAVVREYF